MKLLLWEEQVGKKNEQTCFQHSKWSAEVPILHEMEIWKESENQPYICLI